MFLDIVLFLWSFSVACVVLFLGFLMLVVFPISLLIEHLKNIKVKKENENEN